MDAAKDAVVGAKNAVMEQAEAAEADKAKTIVEDVGSKTIDATKSAIETGESAVKDARASAEFARGGAESNVQSVVDATKDQVKGAADAVASS